MKSEKASLTNKQLKELKIAYKSIQSGKEKMWLFSNEGEAFDQEKEGEKFSKSLRSKAVKQAIEELSEIYDS